jgi:hypothetical protein
VLVEEAEVRGEGADEREKDAELKGHRCEGCNAAGAENLRCRASSLPSTQSVARLKPRAEKQSTPQPLWVSENGLITTDSTQKPRKPLLFVDIDGVISLWGFASDRCPPGTWHNVEGIGHFLSSTAAGHLHELAERFDLVWCSGWEEKAPEHLPALIGAPDLPHLTFARNPGRSRAHWKLDAIDAYAGERPLAWLDDALDDACAEWAEQRAAPTLLVRTEPASGLTGEHVALLRGWAAQQAAR